jgi:hypothetical protein
LTEVAAEVDRTRPQNHELVLNEKGEPALKKLRAKTTPENLAQLEEALHEKIPERHLLDVLARIDHVTEFTRYFGPLSGSEPKTPDARERHLLTIFAYGTHLGPHQMARHLKGQLPADQLTHLNYRHFTVAKLEAAQRDIIDRFHLNALVIMNSISRLLLRRSRMILHLKLRLLHKPMSSRQVEMGLSHEMLDYLDALRFASRECVGESIQAQILQSNLHQVLEPLGQGEHQGNCGWFGDPFDNR